MMITEAPTLMILLILEPYGCEIRLSYSLIQALPADEACVVDRTGQAEACLLYTSDAADDYSV